MSTVNLCVAMRSLSLHFTERWYCPGVVLFRTRAWAKLVPSPGERVVVGNAFDQTLPP